MKKFQKLSLVLALGLLGGNAANAAVIYNSLPAVSTYADNGLGISGAGFFAANEFFTGALCPTGCKLGNITLNLQSNSESTDGFQLQVIADKAGPQGAVLISMNNPSAFSTSGDNNLFTPNGTLILAANTNYWVKLIDSASNNGPVSWNYNYTPTQAVANQPAQIAYDLGFGFQPPRSGAFMMKIEATSSAIPIPGAIWMMGSALVGLVASWRKKAGS